MKWLVFLCLCLTGMVAAGLYGAVHNQLSYSVGPSYFHDVKFSQFGINRDLPPRIGAAQVGWLSSWWMGLVMAVPAMLVGLFRIARSQVYFSAGLGAIGLAMFCALLGGFCGLAYGFITDVNALVAQLPNPDAITDPESFMRAGLMHDGTYLGGILGAFAALWAMWKAGSLRVRPT